MYNTNDDVYLHENTVYSSHPYIVAARDDDIVTLHYFSAQDKPLFFRTRTLVSSALWIVLINELLFLWSSSLVVVVGIPVTLSSIYGIVHARNKHKGTPRLLLAMMNVDVSSLRNRMDENAVDDVIDMMCVTYGDKLVDMFRAICGDRELDDDTQYVIDNHNRYYYRACDIVMTCIRIVTTSKEISGQPISTIDSIDNSLRAIDDVMRQLR